MIQSCAVSPAGGIVIARCSVQCAVYSVRACQDWPAGRATLQLLVLYSLQVVKRRPCVVQEPYLLLGRHHQLASRKHTSKQRKRRSTALLRAA